MMIRAIKTRQMDFLKMIWACNKNFEFIEGQDESENSDSSDDNSIMQDQKHIFMYDDLIK